MKVSLSWLEDYVAIKANVNAIAESLTMAGLEVETVSNRYENLKSVVVGRIESLIPHPNADKLRLAQVDIGGRKIKVVCGAPNAEEKMNVPCALPGTELWSGMKISEGSIRGQVSEGMLCSAFELALEADDSGLMVLDGALAPGDSIVDALGLNDSVIEIDLTPNRPDCLSITGIAREIAAFSDTRITYPKVDIPKIGGPIDDYINIEIKDPELCPRYAGQVLVDIKIGPSPFWLQDKLISIGLRPINNVVDITNFVMMEMGQPLHAFDLDQLAESRIVVRRADDGELFSTLDEKERKLDADMLMICDGEKPVAIAGVMGGLNSEISDQTTRVLIESAYFNPISIRKTSKKLGLHTDASHRFERGVDPNGTTKALCRAARLMSEICGGTLIDGIVDEHPKPPEPFEIKLNTSATNRLLGTDFGITDIEAFLNSIEFGVTKLDAETISVVPPSYRVDVSRPQDLMEEVARLSGYNNIPTTYPRIHAIGKNPKRHLSLRARIKDIMNGLGYNEVINYSFINPSAYDLLNLAADDLRRSAVTILNPLSEDQSVMRTTLVPGMLTTMQRNLSQQSRHLKLFEIGKVFQDQGQDLQPKESEMLMGLLTGASNRATWHAQEIESDFYDLKGAVEALFNQLGLKEVDFTIADQISCSYTKYGKTAQISIAGQPIGHLGEVHSRVIEQFELKQTAFIFEIDLTRLIDLTPKTKKSLPIPKFPSISRDLTMIIDNTLESKKVIDFIKNLGESTIEAIHLFDVYEGNPIPEKKKSISLRIIYRSHQETLNDAYANNIHLAVTDKVLKSFKADLPT